MQPLNTPLIIVLRIDLNAADGGGVVRAVGVEATAVASTSCCSDCLPIYRVVFDDGGTALLREDQFVCI